MIGLPHLAVQQRPAPRRPARTDGRRIVDEATDCIVVERDGHRFEAAWPPGFSVAVVHGRIALLDPDGCVFARLGDAVVLGGGFLPAEVAHATPRTAATRIFAVVDASRSQTD